MLRNIPGQHPKNQKQKLANRQVRDFCDMSKIETDQELGVGRYKLSSEFLHFVYKFEAKFGLNVLQVYTSRLPDL